MFNLVQKIASNCYKGKITKHQTLYYLILIPNQKGILQFLWFAQYTSFTYTKQIYTYAINYLSTEAVALPCFQVREDICQMRIHRKLN